MLTRYSDRPPQRTIPQRCWLLRKHLAERKDRRQDWLRVQLRQLFDRCHQLARQLVKFKRSACWIGRARSAHSRMPQEEDRVETTWSGGAVLPRWLNDHSAQSHRAGRRLRMAHRSLGRPSPQYHLCRRPILTYHPYPRSPTADRPV